MHELNDYPRDTGEVGGSHYIGRLHHESMYGGGRYNPKLRKDWVAGKFFESPTEHARFVWLVSRAASDLVYFQCPAPRGEKNFGTSVNAGDLTNLILRDPRVFWMTERKGFLSKFPSKPPGPHCDRTMDIVRGGTDHSLRVLISTCAEVDMARCILDILANFQATYGWWENQGEGGMPSVASLDRNPTYALLAGCAIEDVWWKEGKRPQ